MCFCSLYFNFLGILLQAGESNSDRRVRKLAKELLALERAYALLQASVGSAVDAEREETVRMIMFMIIRS